MLTFLRVELSRLRAHKGVERLGFGGGKRDGGVAFLWLTRGNSR